MQLSAARELFVFAMLLVVVWERGAVARVLLRGCSDVVGGW